MNVKNELLIKLQNYKKEDIVITNHAKEQAIFRGINLEEVKENIINPERLYYVDKQISNNDEKFDCYFGYSKTQCHRYILVLKDKCVVCTVIKINRRWQHLVDKHARI